MNSEDIRQHWKEWAQKYGGNLQATTRTPTAKLLELDALERYIRPIARENEHLSILEFGCGNGINCIHLAKVFSGAKFTGVDYIPEMIFAARSKSQEHFLSDRLNFIVGDILEADSFLGKTSSFDCVFTDRCIINLETVEKQIAAVAFLAKKVRKGGRLILIENSTISYGLQNDCRTMMGLSARIPASFNKFVDDEIIISTIQSEGLKLISVEDFSSLHDLVLYALLPSVNNGQLKYDDPIVEAAAALSIQLAAIGKNQFGPFGQNRLFAAER